MKCKCPPNSPFHWKQDKSPTVFAKDQLFSPGKMNVSLGATKRLQDLREQGSSAAIIKGISRNREAEMLRIKMFSVFTRAVPSK